MRILSSVPVYKAGGIGLTSIEESDGIIQVRFIPYRLVNSIKYGTADQFWRKLYGRAFVTSYRPDNPTYNQMKSKYESEEEYPFEGLSPEAMISMASLIKESA